MRRGLWVGAAIAVALAAAAPLWLMLDDGGVRRLGAIDSTTVSGNAGRVTIAGVNSGAPLPIDSFSFHVTRPVGAPRPDEAISMTLQQGASAPQLVGRAVQGTNAATAKVELVASISGQATVYLTFDLTNVTIDGVGDSFSAQNSGSASGTQAFTLKYESLAVTCIPSVCAQPTHQAGTATELAVPDLGAKAVRFQTVQFGVPKGFKSAPAFRPMTATMELNYLVPEILRRAREGGPLEKGVTADLVRIQDDDPRKVASYKLGGASVVGLAISAAGAVGNATVEVEFLPRRVGVFAYSYTAGGALDKSTSFCWDIDKSSTTSCAGL